MPDDTKIHLLYRANFRMRRSAICRAISNVDSRLSLIYYTLSNVNEQVRYGPKQNDLLPRDIQIIDLLG